MCAHVQLLYKTFTSIIIGFLLIVISNTSEVTVSLFFSFEEFCCVLVLFSETFLLTQKDKARQLAEAKKKHLVSFLVSCQIFVLISLQQESKLSYEEAIIAKESHIQETREKVHQVKEEVSKLQLISVDPYTEAMSVK